MWRDDSVNKMSKMFEYQKELSLKTKMEYLRNFI